MTRSAWSRVFLAVLALAACAAATGWFVDGFYAEDGVSLEAKGRYADLVILIVMVPLGLGAFTLERKGHYWARAFMLGLVVYLGFMHGFLAFDYHENVLFVVYATTLGLCLLLGVSGLIDFARIVDRPAATPPIRVASVVLLLVALGGYRYWVSDAAGALVDGVRAQSLTGTVLPANAARVIDMAITLPLAAFGAVRLWARRGDGLAISAVMSTFVILIGFTVIVMEVGLANTTGQGFAIAKVIGYGSNVSLGLITATITYRALGRSKLV